MISLSEQGVPAKKFHHKTIRILEKGLQDLIVVPVFYISCGYCLCCFSKHRQ